MKSIWLLFLSFSSIYLFSQNWKYDLGTGTGSHTSGISTAFLPTPSTGGGTARVRVGSAGGSFTLDNPGLASLGSNSELNIVAPTSTSVNKFSIYDYTASKTFTTKFTIVLGGTGGSSSASSGTFYFFQGDGAGFSDNNGFSGAQIFTGLRFQFGASGAITLNNRAAGSWNSTGITGTPFSQGNVYTVEIIGNNTTTTIDYSRGSVAANKFDLWINGVLIGDDLAKAQLSGNTNIDSWMFYGESSTSNVANIFLDDMEYSNYICGNIAINPITELGLTEQCIDGDWTVYGNTTNRYFAVKKNGNTMDASIDVTVGSTISTTSSNGVNREHGMFLMGRYWNASLNSGSIMVPVDIRFFYNPTELDDAKTARDNSYTTLPSSTIAVTNGNIVEWFKNTNNVPFDASYIANIIGNRFPSSYIKFSSPTISTLNGNTYVELAGISSFSGGTGAFSYGPQNTSGLNALPITWHDFYCNKEPYTNDLIWQTLNEVNSDYFLVESSIDGIHFESISQSIIAAKNSSIVQHYRFTDERPTMVTYYRIKQVDNEGQSDYSKTIVVSRNDVRINLPQFYISTINSNSSLHIEVKQPITEYSNVEIYDMMGRRVTYHSFSGSSFDFDKRALTMGIYVIRLSNGNYIETHKHRME